VPERGVAIVRDDQQFATEIPYRVQQGRGRMPRVGDYWYVDRSMGPWVFSAYIAKNDTDIGTFANGEQIRIGTVPSSTAVIAARVAGGTPIVETGVNGDVVPQYTRYANGRTEWGPGGSASRDTFLYRSASATLKTDGALVVGGALTTGSGAVTGALSVGGALTAASVHVTGSTTLDGTLTATGAITANNGISLPVGKYALRGGFGTPSFQNGWGNYTATAGFQAVRYIEYPDGTGGLTGTAKAGTLTSGTVIFNLPTQMRPAGHHAFICPADGGLQAQVRIESGGDVQIQSPDATITWVGLSHCRWPLASAY
jgi:hypothetical protein